MVPLETVLQGLGEGIEKLFTTDEMLLLKALERGKLRDQQKLVDIVLDMNTKWDLLRDKEKRAVIINRLEEDDAFELAFLLGIEHGGFPYKAIQEKRFNKNSKAEKVFFAFFGFQVPEKEEEIEHETIEGVEALHGLYKHQRDSLRKVEKFLEDDGRVLLHMPTGSGKTRTAMNLISKHLNRTDNSLVLWLAHSEELCEQAVGEFKKSWSHLGDR
ncbi:MAG: DEAD/DEAH box helicase family protein, partial [Candidatus Thermoplasmatota archaeon]|nr:DEAD/DEAH box helicase family protein [Candidatus Thermoplasmatota archaeon]